MRTIDALRRVWGGAVIVAVATQSAAVTRLVPEEYADIRLALEASKNGDVVLVQPGRYSGSLNFQSKNVMLASTDGPVATVIEGSFGDTVTIGPGGSIGGFTITRRPELSGTAVSVAGAGTRIHDNIFEGNREGTFAAAIEGFGASPQVVRNVFRNNTCFQYGLLWFVNEAEPLIANNIFANNRCTALHLVFPNGPQASAVTNNTFVGNDVALSFSVFQSFSDMHVFRNNLIAGNETGVVRTGQPSVRIPVWENNLVFGNTTDYDGLPSQAGMSGNISANPRFVNPGSGNYHLREGSPAIDAGHRDGPVDDLDGNPRPLDGDGDQIAANDIGAFEFVLGAAPTRTATPTSTIGPLPPTPTAVVGGPFGPFPAGASLFVDHQNSGLADGSALHPFRSIQDAVDATTMNVAIGVAAGTYKETITLRPGIELLGSGPDRTTIAGGSVTAVRSADRVRLDGFHIVSDVAQSGRGVVECTDGGSTEITNSSIIANNTIVGAAGVFIQGDSNPMIVNNIIAFGPQGLYPSVNDPAQVLAQVWNNNVFGNGGPNDPRNYPDGVDQTGINGNISVDPLLTSAENGDLHVTCRSPVIDAGMALEDLIDDIDGERRPFDGDGNGAARVDIGADEFVVSRPPRTWRVPADFATPSAALTAAIPCDEIVVGAGTYDDRLNFAGRDVTVRSAIGPHQTRLLPADGAIEIGPLGELRGFTIVNGAGWAGPTVIAHGSGSVISENWFDGGAAADGRGFGGISVVDAVTTVQRNRFRRSRCSDETPSALVSIARGSARVVNNVITDSTCNGIEATGGLLLLYNTIVANRIGVLWSDPGGQALPSSFGNIIVDNSVGIDAEERPAFPGGNWIRNLVFGNGANYVDSPNVTGESGNLSANPSFVNARGGDYHLRPDSPAIDAGEQNFFPITVDFDGQPRPVDGDGDQVARSDIGAFELQRCTGDCNGNARVSIDELVTGVSISLERAPLEQCARFDINGDRRVSVDELVRAVNSTLLGCA